MLPKDIGAVIKSSDFVALRLYRCELYERCAKLCQRNICRIIDGHHSPISRLSFVYREFVRLMDDDIVSLVGTAVLADGSKTQSMFNEPISISQLTMLVYLLTQCQIKIVNSKSLTCDISPLADVLDLMAEAHELIPSDDALDQLILKLAERLAVMCITEHINKARRQKAQKSRQSSKTSRNSRQIHGTSSHCSQQTSLWRTLFTQ